MHVRLEHRDSRRLVEPRITVRPGYFTRRDVEDADRLSLRASELLRVPDVLRLRPLGKEIDPELHLRVDLFTYGMEVVAQSRLRAARQEQTGVGRVDLRLLSGRVLDEEDAASHGFALFVLLDGVRQGMVHDLPREISNRPSLDRRDVAILFEIEVLEQVSEEVRTRRRDRVVREPDDKVGLTDLPRVRRREFRGRGRVGRVALRRPVVDPLYDRRDLRIGE